MIGFFALAAPIAKVEDRVIQSSNAFTSSSFLDLFLQSDIVVKCVMLFLIMASLWSWTIIFDRYISISMIKRKMANVEKMFWSGQSIDSLFKYVSKNKESHPIANVLSAAIEEWNCKSSQNNANNYIRDRIENSMQVATSKSISAIEVNIGSLATIASSSPFIGLFGTVWGIMVSFQSIAASKNTTLAVVAPGIAEALLATAFGLIAAIPAVIFYNKFMASIDDISVRTEDFRIELTTIILRELEK